MCIIIGDCTSIYRPLYYPFRFLTITPTKFYKTRITTFLKSKAPISNGKKKIEATECPILNVSIFLFLCVTHNTNSNTDIHPSVSIYLSVCLYVRTCVNVSLAPKMEIFIIERFVSLYTLYCMYKQLRP